MRCELVATLLHNPEIVFLDEPTIGLDIIAKKKIRELLRKLNEEEGTTIILTSHDMEDIEKICKRIIIINKGNIVFDGPIEKIKKSMKNKIVEIYLDEKTKEISPPLGAKVIEKGQFKIVLEVDTSKLSIANVLNFFFTKYEVADLIVKETPIEEIIEDIYRK
jgi:ABC-2 type transport system ATP-binding protein